MKICVTGTFDVPRADLETKIRETGNEVVELSKKTDLLIVGEKTASPKRSRRRSKWESE